MKRKHKKILTTILIILVLIFHSIDKPNNESNSIKTDNDIKEDLKIYFLDVGQADSILINIKDKTMLIDAGNNSDGKLLSNYIKNDLNISTIDILVGTHPHEDHIGGLDDIIENFNINEVYMPEAISTSKTFEDVLDAIEAKELEITIPEENEKFSLDEGVFQVISTGTGESDLNDSSIVLKLTYKEIDYLFTGDATSKVERKILNKDIEADVLKVGHHGSKYSTTESFLSKVKPKYAIISCAKENSYGHPHKETLNLLKEKNIETYLTSELGTILLTSDGTNIKITNMKTNTNG